LGDNQADECILGKQRRGLSLIRFLHWRVTELFGEVMRVGFERFE
jgi:hypothetical protein